MGAVLFQRWWCRKGYGMGRGHCVIYQPNHFPWPPPPTSRPSECPPTHRTDPHPTLHCPPSRPNERPPAHRFLLQEEELFYRDMSEEVVRDDQLIRLMTFPNVLITPHQGMEWLCSFPSGWASYVD